MVYLIVVGLICTTGTIDCYSKINNKAEKINVTREMTKKECVEKTMILRKYITDNKLGKPIVVCRINWEKVQ